jgi:hypothetical protein
MPVLKEIKTKMAKTKMPEEYEYGEAKYWDILQIPKIKQFCRLLLVFASITGYEPKVSSGAVGSILACTQSLMIRELSYCRQIKDIS